MKKSQPLPAFDTVFERRKEAPFHYLARADNAFFSARLIRTASTSDLTELCHEIGYRGNTGIALHESYSREIGVAIELVIKAVICRRIERNKASGNGLPKTHKLIDLWQSANLPHLDAVQFFNLYLLSVVISWSGRYPVPTDEIKYDTQLDELRRLGDAAYPPKHLGSIPIRKAHGLDDEVLDNLYALARNAFLKMTDC